MALRLELRLHPSSRPEQWGGGFQLPLVAIKRSPGDPPETSAFLRLTDLHRQYVRLEGAERTLFWPVKKGSYWPEAVMLDVTYSLIVITQKVPKVKPIVEALNLRSPLRFPVFFRNSTLDARHLSV